MKTPPFVIKGKLTSRIGTSVTFSPPETLKDKGGKHYCGKVIDEVWADEEVNSSEPRKPRSEDDWGDYSFCAQLIEFQDGERMIRLAYYRRPPGEDYWRFASQTTITTDRINIKKLFEKTLLKNDWFKNK